MSSAISFEEIMQVFLQALGNIPSLQQAPFAGNATVPILYAVRPWRLYWFRLLIPATACGISTSEDWLH